LPPGIAVEPCQTGALRWNPRATPLWKERRGARERDERRDEDAGAASDGAEGKLLGDDDEEGDVAAESKVPRVSERVEVRGEVKEEG